MNIVERLLDRAIKRRGYRPQSIKTDGNLRRTRLMQWLEIETVLDVGANNGQYGGHLRGKGYTGRIISYEPLSHPFAQLTAASAMDPLWEAHQIALGETDGEAEINVSIKDSWSSFMPRDEQTQADRLKYVGVEKVKTARLDSLAPVRGRTWLKLDVQGYEMHVFAGAQQTLRQVIAVECEITLEPAYVGQPTPREIFNYMDDQGFRIATINTGRLRPTGHSQWLDAIFERR